MKYIKLFEAWKPLIEVKYKDGTVLRYKEEWKTARSKERNDLTNYLMDIFQELKDDGYRVRDGGWMASNDYPYIWISSRRRREGMDWNVVDDCVERAIDYLESNGFVTEVEKMNVDSRSAQMNLFFDKKSIGKTNESMDANLKSDLMDSFQSVEDAIGHNDPGSGVKIKATDRRDRKYGVDPDNIKVTILPKLFTMADIEHEMPGHPNDYKQMTRFRKTKQHFKKLDYAPAKNMSVELIDDIIGCAYHAEGYWNIKIDKVVVAWRNGGETGGSGELIKSFKVGGIQPNGESTKGSYDLDYLPTFLKEKIFDRLAWIRIYYKQEINI